MRDRTRLNDMYYDKRAVPLPYEEDMDEDRKYTAFKIPQHEVRQTKETEPSNDRPASANVALFADTRFAEIEFEVRPGCATAGETALRFFSSVTPPQPIEQRTIDPIRQKFFDMRSLATDRPFARDDAELFYRQAKFMEDFTDDYENNTRFFMYFPYYQHMGYEQLRTYFTWRTKTRQGKIQPTSMSYVFLYIYELLSGVGVNDAIDGLNKLVLIWNEFKKSDAAIENYLPLWVKDYHVYYELPHSFTDFVKEHNLQKYYSLSLIFDTNVENNLELWNCISSYDIVQSKFFSDGNEQLFMDCFNAVLRGISDFCASCNTRFEDLLIYNVSKRTPWQPFKKALFYQWHQQPDRQVIMPGQERYYCKNNRWSANLPIYYSTQKDFVGYIIKKTESCLRQAVKYKYKLSADMKVAGYSFRELRGTVIKIAELDIVIEEAVEGFHKGLTRTIVTVDHANLERIREEALGTQERLVVLEDEGGNSEFGIRNPEISDASNASDVNDANVQECDKGIEISEQTELGVLNDDDDGGGGWAGLKSALSEMERRALGIILHGDLSIKAFADENGIMLEILADNINEKAVDYIGDNILELSDTMIIYDEYKEQIADVVI